MASEAQCEYPRSDSFNPHLISCQNSLPLKLEKGEAENELFRGVQSISY